MKYPAYPSYRPTGIEWLGNVPEDWEVKQLKWAILFQRGHDLPTDEREEGSIPLVTSAGISATHSVAAAKAPGIVTGRYGTLGEFYLIEQDYWPLNTTLYSISLRGNHPAFLRYMLSHLSPLFLLNAVKSAVPGIDRNDVHPIKTAIPPFSEQVSIAAYLDRETGRMDRLIGKNRELIDRLKEKRTALISRTVNSGLPAAAALAVGLPENHAFKPSGQDWLRDIPTHWEVRKFAREVGIAEGQVDPEKEPYASMLLIGPEHVESGTGRLLQQTTAADQAAESGKYLCRKGDVVYSKIRPALRKLAIAPVDCLCSADMYPLRGRQRIENKFIYWLFLTEQFSAWSVLEADRVAMPKINRDTLNELRMPVPPRTEQFAIAAYLELETTKLDALIAKVVAAIERLQEYRVALITAAVTGKIDVRRAVA